MGRGTLTPQEEELKRIISDNVRQIIDKEGLSQAEFARRAGIPPTTLSGYVKGVTRPNAINLQKISYAYGIPKADIDPSYKEGYSLEQWQEKQKTSSTLAEINRVSSKLDEPRQQVVLETAKEQYKEQKQAQKKVIPLENNDNILTEEELQEAVDQAVAFDGRPLNDEEKEMAKQLLRKTWEEKHGQR